MLQPASIVVLNWNGVELLKQNLPHVKEAVAATGGHHELIVVDNGSTDGSVNYIRHHHPGMRVVALPENVGLVKGYNIGSSFASHHVVLHLNNSVRVNRDFLRMMLPHFQNPEVFAVHPKLVDARNGTIEAELSFATFDRHLLFPRQPHAYAPDAPYYLAPCFSMYAPGGCSAYHRARYWQLRGNDEIYSPFHWEESDLSYRAWKRGWKVLYEPRSVGYHDVNATIGRIDPVLNMERYFRNWLLFNWVNLTDENLLEQHFRNLGTFVKTDVLHFNAYSQALKYIPNILSRRQWERPFLRLSDREVMAVLADNGTGVPNGTFIGFENRIYRVERGRRRHVPSDEVLRAHEGHGNILAVGADVLEQIPEGEPLGWPEGVGVSDPDGCAWLLSSDRRYAVDSRESLGLLGFEPGRLFRADTLENTRLEPDHLDLGLAGSATVSEQQFRGLFRLLVSGNV